MQGDAGIQFGVRRTEAAEPVERRNRARKCRGAGSGGAVAVEEGQHGIAHELDDFAAGLADGRHDAVEIGVEQFQARVRRAGGWTGP